MGSSCSKKQPVEGEAGEKPSTQIVNGQQVTTIPGKLPGKKSLIKGKTVTVVGKPIQAGSVVNSQVPTSTPFTQPSTFNQPISSSVQFQPQFVQPNYQPYETQFPVYQTPQLNQTSLGITHTTHTVVDEYGNALQQPVTYSNQQQLLQQPKLTQSRLYAPQSTLGF